MVTHKGVKNKSLILVCTVHVPEVNNNNFTTQQCSLVVRDLNARYFPPVMVLCLGPLGQTVN